MEPGPEWHGAAVATVDVRNFLDRTVIGIGHEYIAGRIYGHTARTDEGSLRGQGHGRTVFGLSVGYLHYSTAINIGDEQITGRIYRQSLRIAQCITKRHRGAVAALSVRNLFQTTANGHRQNIAGGVHSHTKGISEARVQHDGRRRIAALAVSHFLDRI